MATWKFLIGVILLACSANSMIESRRSPRQIPSTRKTRYELFLSAISNSYLAILTNFVLKSHRGGEIIRLAAFPVIL